MLHTFRFITLSLSVALGLLAACGGSSSTMTPGMTPDAASQPDAPGVDAPAAAAPDISGAWVSACLPGADGSYFVLDFDIAQDTWALDYVVYGDDACTAKLVTVHIDGPYALGEPSADVDGAYEGLFSFTNKTITPHADGLVGMLNAADPACGTEAWTLDATQSVYETGCAGFGQYPMADCTADYDLVYLDAGANTLQFGARPADNDMCTEDERPTALNPALFTRP